jgi:phosphoribosylglycinamide formyltransferase 1
MARRRIAILISGRGSNMASLIAACESKDYPADIVGIISNRRDALGLGAAGQAGIPTQVVDHSEFETREDFDAELTRRLEEIDADLVCLAGFMRLLTEGFVSHWHDKLINIHPSLLPAFKGLDTHARALAMGIKITGCSVHFVRADMDSGPIIAQAAVPVFTSDTEETLSARVLTAEHKLYPHALALVASGRARAVGERVVIDDDDPVDTQLFSPPTKTNTV